MSSSLPATQSAWQLKKLGSGIDGLDLIKEVPVPKAERGQLLVRIRATSLNYRDLLLAKGQYPMPMPDGQVPLSDGAGEVVAVGPEVKDFVVGDRVAAIFTPKWAAGDNRSGIAFSGSLGGDVRGVLQQYIAIDTTAVVKLPTHLSFEQAASIPCAGVTAYNALLHGSKPLRADHSVLVMGTGGVSIFAAQIARASGARVFATSSSDDKLKRLVDLGLCNKEDTINYKTTVDWGKEVKKRTGGIGVDHVIEVGGQGTIHQAIDAVRPDGEITVIGLVAGYHPEKGIDPMRVLGGGFSVRGVLVGSRSYFEELLQLYVNNKHLKGFVPIVDKVFPFVQAKEAYRFVESGAHFGKVVISVE